MPRAWTMLKFFGTGCNLSIYPTTCTIAGGTGVTSIVNTGLGQFTVTLNYTPLNTDYAVFITAWAPGANARSCFIDANVGLNTAAPHFTVRCTDLGVPAGSDNGFSLLVMD